LIRNKNKYLTYSATTVFPADVWAETSTDWLFCKHVIASRWNGSRLNLYSLAGGPTGAFNGTYSKFGGKTTWLQIDLFYFLYLKQNNKLHVNMIQLFQQYVFAFGEHFQKN
jgi:hypothetical protein